MWVLECDGDFLQGKRIWLRPGRTYLFGRTKPEGGKCGFEILHKSVSRKHLTVTVTDVNPDDGSGHGPRSHLILKDENTKVGTVVDGNKFRNRSVTLCDNAHHFRLGSLTAQFRIVWKPVVLSFTFPSKTTNGGNDPLVSIRGRLDGLDVEAVLPYDRARTTHVVATKRNTAKCLQALINGKFVVDHSFIDAVVYATTQSTLDDPESLSPLEEDFDKHWPNALDFVPAPSKEPGQRPAKLFAPDPERQNVFENYIFVFCDPRQFESLMPPITNGGGTALHFPVLQGSTTAAEIASYYREVISKKDATTAPSEGDENVLLVRFGGDKGYEAWANDVQVEVQNILGLECIEQNEFLDIILMKVPERLKRKLAIPTAPKVTRAEVSEETRDESTKVPGPSRPVRPRGVIRSAFRGFDDGFDSFQIESQRTGEAESMPYANPRKRSPPSDDDAEREDALLPAAAAMKRRRLQEGSRTPTRSLEPEAANSPKKSPRVKKEIDIVETVRKRREAEDEAARNEEMALQQSLTDLSFEEMNRLAQIEEMDVSERKSHTAVNELASERWDPKWNGRKNFKKFRRQGEKGEVRRGQTVIVPLEEVKKRTQGIGEHYWLEPRHEQGSSRRELTSSRRGYARTDTENGNDEDAVSQSHQTFASARSQLGEGEAEREGEVEVPRELADLNEQTVIDVDEPRMTRRQEHVAATTRQLTTRAGAKRGAQTTRGAASKKTKIASKTSSREEGEGEGGSDTEDEMKFRIRRRKG